MTFADEPESIAIVGMACRVPGAPDLAAFKDMLINGRSGRVELDLSECLAAGVPEEVLDAPEYVPVAYPLEDFDCFDADFFGYTPAAAAQIDPQHRLFLQCAWHALEDAGHRPDSHGGNIGVFGSSNISTYLLFNLLDLVDPRRPSQAIDYLLANDKDYLASRVSYKLDLRGPSMSVQTACSSSLVAVCQAAQSLLNHECDMAIAGGAAVRTPHRVGYTWESGGVLSPDGWCRSFDAKAQGTVFGNGVGAILVKRLSDAIADGDAIHAVITGYAVNNDGNVKAGFAAPALQAQFEVIEEAMAMAELDRDAIGMVEAHGTGTAIGDPIELSALDRALGQQNSAECWLGSVKSNVGHLDSAAGVVGLIKAALSVSAGTIFPTLNFDQINPKFDIGTTRFEVPTQKMAWTPNGTARYAGVSSFAMGGTNAHVILRQPPDPPASMASSDRVLLNISGRTEQALSDQIVAYARQLERVSETDLPDFAATAHIGRTHFENREVVIGRKPAAIAAALKGNSAEGVTRIERPKEKAGKLAFLFSGQGNIVQDAGCDLYAENSEFRSAICDCQDVLGDRAGRDFLRSAFTRQNDSKNEHRKLDDWRTPLHTFSLQYGLFRSFSFWGAMPDFVIGHSLGEYAAAVAAKAMDMPTALELLLARSELFRDLVPVGQMLAVSASQNRIIEVLDGAAAGVDFAALNGPEATVISGAQEAIAHSARLLERAAIRSKLLEVPFAYHSRMIDPLLQPFQEVVERHAFATPNIRMISTCAGFETDEVSTADYWVRQTRQPVQLHSALQTLIDESTGTFVELGASSISYHGKSCWSDRGYSWIPALNQHSDENDSLLVNFGMLVAAGHADPSGLHKDAPTRRVRLPLYPFARKRHWIEPKRDSPPQEAEVLAPNDLWKEVTSAAFAQAAQPQVDLGIAEIPALQQAGTCYSIAAMQKAFRELAPPESAEMVSLGSVLQESGVDPRFRPLLQSWVKRLASLNLAMLADEDWQIESGCDSDYLDAKKDLETILSGQDSYQSYILSCGENLVPILQGETSPLETLFPRGSYKVVDALYRTSAPARYFNDIAAASMAALIGRMNAPLRVLEIGGGTGGLTSAILPVLRTGTTQYTFTDVSSFFFARATREFGAPDFDCRLLDIENNPLEAGFEAEGFDLVVASNVLHAVPDVEAAVRHATSLLRPGGWLLLNEVTRNEPWLEVTTGLIEGWQVYDDDWRDEGPLISAAKWLELLTRCGFDNAAHLPHAFDGASLLGQHLILAKKRGETTEAGEHSRSEMAASSPAETSVRSTARASIKLAGLKEDERLSKIEMYLRGLVANAIGEPIPSQIDPEAGLFELGLDSLKAIDLAAQVSDDIGVELPSAELFDFPTIASLAPRLLELWAEQNGAAVVASGDEDAQLIEQLRRKLDGN